MELYLFYYLVAFAVVCGYFALVGICSCVRDELAIRRYMNATGMPRNVALKNVPLFFPTAADHE